MKTLLFPASLAAVLGLAAAAPASAAVIVNPNGSVTVNNLPGSNEFTMNFNGFDSSAQVPIPGLTAKIVFTFNGIEGNTFKFGYTLENTSGGQIDQSRVTIFGFNSAPAITSVSIGSGDQFNVIAAGQQPNGMPLVEICFKDKGPDGNCTGASKGEAQGGAAATGTFGLTYDPAQSSITLSGFTVRYQGIYADGPDLFYSDGSASGIGTPVPEPATWAMLIGGFGLVGAAMRRRRSGAFATA